MLQRFAAEGEQRTAEAGARAAISSRQSATSRQSSPGPACQPGRRSAQQGHSGQSRGAHGVLADPCGVGVGGVHQQVEALLVDERRQPFGAAVAADPDPVGQVAGHLAQPGEAVEMRRTELAGEGQGPHRSRRAATGASSALLAGLADQAALAVDGEDFQRHLGGHDAAGEAQGVGADRIASGPRLGVCLGQRLLAGVGGAHAVL